MVRDELFVVDISHIGCLRMLSVPILHAKQQKNDSSFTIYDLSTNWLRYDAVSFQYK